ncbi:hypothetical protein [Roseomonas fluvialis]|uniref:Uncharacterized protein n=1 Tax=Roseomonas fluvialis TaxID=1750527 RepID=A0ABM7Y9M2_9PROT|nr:hypothetical protein [Roseomonas fluvialis]BDG74678.1 hypothetical protein Rmf_46070 [Roseomonas fluvialis]
MNHAAMLLTALLLALPLLASAQAPTPPEAGGPQPGRAATVGRDAGPANHPPRTDSPHAVNRGTDGSAAGHAHDPDATGTTPQGMLGTSTAGARAPGAPVPPQPPR